MTKAELINAVAQKTELSKKDSEKAVVAVLDAISETLAAGEKVALVGFGTFEVKERAAREGINPRTKEKIEIPASKLPVFKAGKALKEVVSKLGKARLSSMQQLQGIPGLLFYRNKMKESVLCAWINI